MDLAIIEQRLLTCEGCDNRVEFSRDRTAVRCKARGGGTSQCARCWAKLDTDRQTLGCPIAGKWPYPVPGPKPAPNPKTAPDVVRAQVGSRSSFAFRTWSAEFNANIETCRQCPAYLRTNPETCAVDRRNLFEHARSADCPINKFPHMRPEGPALVSAVASDAATPLTAPASPKFPPTPAADPIEFPIDLVVMWVDSSDPDWQASFRYHVPGAAFDNARFTSADELKYLLRSVEQYASWINRIHLVTNGQVPSWLNRDHPRLSVVPHDQFIEPQYLPTFNSQAIECRIHRLGGLAEHFLFANDDMLFTAPVQPGHFFTADGRAKLVFGGDIRSAGSGIFDRMKNNAALLLDAALAPGSWRRGWHHIKPYRRSTLEEVERRLPDAIAAAGTHKTRCGDDVAWNCGLWPNFALASGAAIEVPEEQRLRAVYINAGDAPRASMQRVLQERGHLLCVNNAGGGDAPEVKRFLQKLSPRRSKFEKERISVRDEPIGTVSFSLYGEHPNYCLGLLENLRLLAEHYPGWAAHVFLDQGHYLTDRLVGLGARIFPMPPAPDAMWWRLNALHNAVGKFVVFRDADSRVTARERRAVTEWCRSGRSLHCMADHPVHSLKPIMGGLWGITAQHKQTVLALVESWAGDRTSYGSDERFLGELVWPRFANDAMVHGHTRTVLGTPLTGPTADGHLGQRVRVALDEFDPSRVRMCVLNPAKYPHRLVRFRQHIGTSVFLSQFSLERLVATPYESLETPASFKNKSQPHYYAATFDHAQAIESAVADGVDLLIFFEDDATIEPGFDAMLEKTWRCLPFDWEAIQLGSHNNLDRGPGPISREGYTQLTGQVDCHAYVLNRPGLRRTAEWLRSMRDVEIIDRAFAMLQKSSGKWFGPPRWISKQTSKTKGRSY